MNFCDIFPTENSNTGFTYVYVDFGCFYGLSLQGVYYAFYRYGILVNKMKLLEQVTTC